jgi:hypothetical protein
MRGGHYVAYVRGGEKSKGKAEKESDVSVWYHVSDAYVRSASLDEVLRCEAYILFYEKIWGRSTSHTYYVSQITVRGSFNTPNEEREREREREREIAGEFTTSIDLLISWYPFFWHVTLFHQKFWSHSFGGGLAAWIANVFL